MKFEDMAEFELRIQLDRLNYIRTLLNHETYCNFPPRKIYIEPTNICNLKCVHCVHDGTMTRKPGYFDLELYKDLIEQVKHLALHTKIQFTGVGEPFFHKDIFEMISIAADYGFFTLMNTNANLLDKEKAEKLVDSGLDYLHVSLDGLTPSTYEKIRRGGDFKKVINNLFTLFEARYEKKGYHLAVILGFVEQARNRHELDSYMDFFAKFPFHHVVAGELFNHMGAIQEASEVYTDKNSLPPEQFPACNTPWDLLSFNCDGNAVGCNYDFDNRFVTGSLKDEGVLDIWNNERMRFFRQAILDHNYSEIEKNGPMCSECTIKWQKDYHIPAGFRSEVARMEDYLVRAIKRCSTHVERNLEFRKQEEFIFAEKERLFEELERFARETAGD